MSAPVLRLRTRRSPHEQGRRRGPLRPRHSRGLLQLSPAPLGWPSRTRSRPSRPRSVASTAYRSFPAAGGTSVAGPETNAANVGREVCRRGPYRGRHRVGRPSARAATGWVPHLWWESADASQPMVAARSAGHRAAVVSRREV